MKTSRSSAIFYLSVGAAALGVLATSVYFMSTQASAPAAASLQSGLQTPIPQRESTLSNPDHSEQIERAMSAYSAGKLVAPAGENAFEYYLAALQSKPSDVGAQEAIMELVPVAMTALESAMAANTTADVERLIPLLERADPGAARVVALKQRWQANVANMARQASAPVPTPSLENVPAQVMILTEENNAPESLPRRRLRVLQRLQLHRKLRSRLRLQSMPSNKILCKLARKRQPPKCKIELLRPAL